MSAFPEDPGHFARFAAERDPSVTPTAFVRRSVYGEYLGHLLADAVASGPNRLDRVVDGVTGVEPVQSGVIVRTESRGDFRADHAVLAFGHQPPADPPELPAALTRSRLYVRDPWAVGALDEVPRDRPVLLVGTGLTMFDIAIDLSARGVSGAVAVSRRGLTPCPHDPSVPPAAPGHRPEDLDRVQTAGECVRAVRSRVRAVTAAGGDWRQVVDSIRPVTPELWRRLGRREQDRFLRHARPFWDVHRHRAAPETAAAIERLRSTEWLTVRAARITDARPDQDHVEVRLLPRGGGPKEVQPVGMVVNCTGPATTAAVAEANPVIASLFALGLARPDPLGVGLDVAETGEMIGADGNPTVVLSYVGPQVRGRDGEGTAVPELREHAARVAARLARVYGGEAGGG